MLNRDGEIRSALVRIEGIGQGINQLRAIGVTADAQGVLQLMLSQLEAARRCLDRALGRAPGEPHAGIDNSTTSHGQGGLLP